MKRKALFRQPPWILLLAVGLLPVLHAVAAASGGELLRVGKAGFAAACAERFEKIAARADASQVRESCALGRPGEAALLSRLGESYEKAARTERTPAETAGLRRGGAVISGVVASLSPHAASGRVGEIYGERAGGAAAPIRGAADFDVVAAGPAGKSPASDFRDAPSQAHGLKTAAVPSPVFEQPKIKKSLKYREMEGRLFVKGRSDENRIAPSDVSQGAIGDCYYLASLAAIANTRPAVIRDMIHDNRDGSYSVTFHERVSPTKAARPEFAPVTVRVDDRFPQRGRRPAYAQVGDRSGGTRELWVMSAEKAFAMYKGGAYRAIDGGYPSQAMEEITGNPSLTARPANISIKQLAQWSEKRYAMVIGTLSEERVKRLAKNKKLDPLYASKTLVPGHAYWVESADKKAGTVTIANPWGWKELHVTLTEKQFHSLIDSFFLNTYR